MINKQTVFILGAGASVPYNYPTGIELKERIMNNIDFEITKEDKNTKEIQATKNLLIRGIYTENTTKFINMKKNLLESRRSSIDAFLEHRPEFCDIGKLAIACELIECENARKGPWDWFEHLHDTELARCRSAEDYCQNDIDFVTFNYDRLLEHSLMGSLKSTYGKSEEKCADLIKENFKIVHVHGKLDNLPWEGDDGRAYGVKPASTEEWKKSANGIKIIHEKIEEKSFKKARELIKDAELLVFLGLNLHNTINIDRLNVKENLEGKRIYATVKGLSGPQKEDVRSYFNDNILNLKANIGRTRPKVYDYTAYQLLEEEVRFR